MNRLEGLKLVAEFTSRKKHHTLILRDKHGKWAVSVSGFVKQKRLNASEIVRYLANVLEGK